MKNVVLLLPALLLIQCARFSPPTGYPSSQPGAPPYPAQQPTQALTAPAYPTAAHAAPSPATSSVSWQHASSVRSTSLPGGAEMHEFTARSATESAQVSVVIFESTRCALRVLDQPSSHAGGGAITPLMRNSGAIAGVNGGFFHPDFSTLGLMICDGRKTGQFTRSSLISGAVLMVANEPYLVWNDEFLGETGVAQMLQAGPRLVDGGQPMTTLNRTKNAVRTFVATDGVRRWAIGTVHSTSLAGLGDLLASPGLLPDMTVQRALNLDGGHSTALYVRTGDGQEISRPGWSTVRNYLAVVPR
ncbi:Predicted protein [Prosthecobacter debontii]|uniref:Phosphodiester glycosidase domain-containing protein n=1 Tax=Prosthecobacter debontii TaxID=48467 RepID=A0A1T4XXL2_9BACT|nr:phosphodiester glycosidase family protein [Prosthecobacter debontii]SKA94322.1 Predicted protein [Prosthecobacter debontii]